MAGANWFLSTVGAPRGWQLVFGGTRIDLDNIDWARVEAWDWRDVCVAHLDHGYTGHPATRGIVQPQRGRNFMEPANPDPRDPMDYAQTFGFHGHCTRTGTTLAGKDRNAPYLGAAPGVPLIPYRVTNRSVLNVSGGTLGEPEGTHVGNAIRAALEEPSCAVISISLGSLFGWRPMGEAVDDAYDAGRIIVAAAGQVIHEVVYPGKYRQTISVGGFKPGNWPYWTYGGSQQLQPDIWAPGVDVTRADAELPDNDTATYGYGLGSGTSYATAIVAGLAALFVRKFAPALDAEGYTGWRRTELFRRLLRERALTHVRGDANAKIVDFARVLLRNDVFRWPAPGQLHRAQGLAADMQL